MPKSARSAAPPKIGFWKQRWDNIEAVVGALVEDCLVLLIFIAILTLAFFALGGLAGLGYKPERIEMFETIHYWAYLAVFVVLMLGFVIRIVLHVFRKKA